jgi:hypothetical protein
VLATGDDDNNAGAYITVEELLENMADGADGGDAGQEATLREPTDVQLFEDLINHIDEDDVMFGSPKWLENFKEMKQAAIDPLYQDGGKCPEGCTALYFNLQLQMMKAQHGWSDNSFNELLSYLATTYPMGGNKVQANTYRAKKLI